MLPRGELAFAEEEVDELALARSVGLDQLGQVTVGPRGRGRGQQRADETVEVGAEVVERAGELRVVRAGPVGGKLELGREPHRPAGRVVGAERSHDRELDLATTHGHGARRASAEKRYVEPRRRARSGLKLPPFTCYHTVTI